MPKAKTLAEFFPEHGKVIHDFIQSAKGKAPGAAGRVAKTLGDRYAKHGADLYISALEADIIKQEIKK